MARKQIDLLQGTLHLLVLKSLARLTASPPSPVRNGNAGVATDLRRNYQRPQGHLRRSKSCR